MKTQETNRILEIQVHCKGIDLGSLLSKHFCFLTFTKMPILIIPHHTKLYSRFTS
jgi:hypothetical protein